MCPVFTATAEVTDQEDEGIPEVPQQPSHSTVSSQLEDPSLWDHSYGEQQCVEETAEDATTQTEDFSYSMLQSDADLFPLHWSLTGNLQLSCFHLRRIC